MAVNKVIYGTTVLVDLTSDTITPSVLLEGVTAHDKTGAAIVGTAKSSGDESSFYTLVNGVLSVTSGGATLA